MTNNNQTQKTTGDAIGGALKKQEHLVSDDSVKVFLKKSISDALARDPNLKQVPNLGTQFTDEIFDKFGKNVYKLSKFYEKIKNKTSNKLEKKENLTQNNLQLSQNTENLNQDNEDDETDDGEDQKSENETADQGQEGFQPMKDKIDHILNNNKPTGNKSGILARRRANKTIKKIYKAAEKEISKYDKQINSLNNKIGKLKKEKSLLTVVLWSARAVYAGTMTILFIVLIVGLLLLLVGIGAAFITFARMASSVVRKAFKQLESKIKQEIKKIEEELKKLEQQIKSLQNIVRRIQTTVNYEVQKIQRGVGMAEENDEE